MISTHFITQLKLIFHWQTVSLITKDGSNLISSVLDKSGNGNSYTPSNSSTKPLYVANAQNGLGGIQFGASSTTNLITPNFTSVEDENFTTITG